MKRKTHNCFFFFASACDRASSMLICHPLQAFTNSSFSSSSSLPSSFLFSLRLYDSQPSACTRKKKNYSNRKKPHQPTQYLSRIFRADTLLIAEKKNALALEHSHTVTQAHTHTERHRDIEKKKNEIEAPWVNGKNKKKRRQLSLLLNTHTRKKKKDQGQALPRSPQLIPPTLCCSPE